MEKYFDSRLNKNFRKNADLIWNVIASDILSKVPGKIEKVIDLGAGYGDFINGVESSEKWAVDLWPGLKEHTKPNVQVVVESLLSELKSVPRQHFDLCFMSNVMEHFTMDEGKTILHTAHEILRKGGHLVLMQPNFPYCMSQYFDDYTHKTIFSHESIANFLEDHGFEIVNLYPKYLPLTFKSKAPKPPWLVKLYLQLPFKPLGAQMLVVARKRENFSNV